MADSEAGAGQVASGGDPAAETVGASASARPDRAGGASARPRWWTMETLRWIFGTLLIPLAGIVWNAVQKRDADRQMEIERVRAQEQERVANARSESDIVIRLMPALASEETSPTRGIAFAILLNLASREALSPELASAVQVAVDNAQQRVREGTATPAEREALSRIAAVSDAISPERLEAVAPGAIAGGERRVTAARTLQVEVPRIYIHIFDEAQRPAAVALSRWITGEQHWLVPGIENVTATAERAGGARPRGSGTGEVRFFNEEDQGYAREISAWLGRSGTRSGISKIENLRAPSGQLEVWFPVT